MVNELEQSNEAEVDEELEQHEEAPPIILSKDADALIQRLLRTDLRDAAEKLGVMEARYLVDSYWAVQKVRVAMGNQATTLKKSEEPIYLVRYLNEQLEKGEEMIRIVLDRYTDRFDVGRWMKGITGIGPVISAGLLAHIDISVCPTAGHVWSFAGLNPEQKWEKGQKRPWNATLKTLCFKIGESFVKVQNLDSDYYGKIYARMKQEYIKRNEAGMYAARCAEILSVKNFGVNTDAILWYSGRLRPQDAQVIRDMAPGARLGAAKKLAGEPGSGVAMFPPAHIHAMARRYAVKMFLSHLHHVWYKVHFKTEPPKPFALEHLGHVHFIPPPVGVKKRGRKKVAA